MVRQLPEPNEPGEGIRDHRHSIGIWPSESVLTYGTRDEQVESRVVTWIPQFSIAVQICGFGIHSAAVQRAQRHKRKVQTRNFYIRARTHFKLLGVSEPKAGRKGLSFRRPTRLAPRNTLRLGACFTSNGECRAEL